MKKLIRLTVLVLAAIVTIVTTLYVSIQYGSNITYRKEISIARAYLAETIHSTQPPSAWILQWAGNNPKNAFFFFKIAFEEAGVSASQICRAYTDNPAVTNATSVSFNLHYGRNLPDIQCEVSLSNGLTTVSAGFPLNNCLYHPDYNSDTIIDEKDLVISRAKRNYYKP
ncbi:MAG: hypothetical protein WCJ02_11370 [bacterium]